MHARSDTGPRPISDIIGRTRAIRTALGPDWPRLAALVVDPSRIADCGLWPDQMSTPMARALLEALQRLDAHRRPVTPETISAELRRCGHDAREILRRLRLTMVALARGER